MHGFKYCFYHWWKKVTQPSRNSERQTQVNTILWNVLHCCHGFSFPVKSLIPCTTQEDEKQNRCTYYYIQLILNCVHKWFLKLIKTEWQVSSNGIKLRSSDCICACMDKTPNTPPSEHAVGCRQAQEMQPVQPWLKHKLQDAHLLHNSTDHQHRTPVQAAGETGQSIFKHNGKKNSLEHCSRYAFFINIFNHTTLTQDSYDGFSDGSVKYM